MDRERHPLPSKVKHRFAIACEKPAVDSANAEVARLQHYKKLLLKSGGSPEEIEHVENLLASLEIRKTLEQPEPIGSSKVNNTGQLEMPSMTKNRVIPTMKLRLPVHLQSVKTVNTLRAPKSEPSALVAYYTSPSTSSNGSKMAQEKALTDQMCDLSLGHKSKLVSGPLKKPINDSTDVLNRQMEKCHITPRNETEPKGCICQRKVFRTKCLSCGEIMAGRVNRRCLIHPKVGVSSDHFRCIKCFAHSGLLHEIVEK